MPASIGFQLALVLTLHLFSHSLPHTAILPTHNTIRPQFILSNTPRALMDTESNSTPSPCPQPNHSTTFYITIIERPKRGKISFSIRMPPKKTPANWSVQFVSAVEDGNPLELFKLKSLSGFLICRSGGPIAWESICQNKTALSSCEAEIISTNKCTTEL